MGDAVRLQYDPDLPDRVIRLNWSKSSSLTARIFTRAAVSPLYRSFQLYTMVQISLLKDRRSVADQDSTHPTAGCISGIRFAAATLWSSTPTSRSTR